MMMMMMMMMNFKAKIRHFAILNTHKTVLAEKKSNSKKTNILHVLIQY